MSGKKKLDFQIRSMDSVGYYYYYYYYYYYVNFQMQSHGKNPVIKMEYSRNISGNFRLVKIIDRP
jgi:hypothetical protein